MKKTKLLAPLFGLATVAAVAAPMMACGPKKQSDGTTVMGWHEVAAPEYPVAGYYSSGFTAKASTTYKFKLTIVDQNKIGSFALYDSSQNAIALTDNKDDIIIKVGDKEVKFNITNNVITFNAISEGTVSFTIKTGAAGEGDVKALSH